MKNSITLKSILIVLTFYSFLSFVSYSIDLFTWTFITIFTSYGSACSFIAYRCFLKERKAMTSDESQFLKYKPFRVFGITIFDFSHSFHHGNNIVSEFISKIGEKLSLYRLSDNAVSVELADLDKQLATPERRSFYIATSPPSLLENRISIAIHISHTGIWQNVQWWILSRGYLSYDKVFRFIAFSPFTLPFWIVRFWRRKYDLINRLREIEDGFYNLLDLEGSALAFHKSSLDTLVNHLEEHGVNVDDLRARQVQPINFQVTGDNTTIGTIVQGTVNRSYSQILCTA